ncbi:hypothetical protein [Kordiimonas lacus]|uniref:Uncharacterized protein n=1 Tax=Kordiimonas lacus TaxID=637679 RepID=A0A1G7ADP5_9PROT|nr:hypothetical protein [Kordiimonas lacus]SDE12803.1 hypothetical protein SAMN04488071_2186 [Kordiimonas lacus]
MTPPDEQATGAAAAAPTQVWKKAYGNPWLIAGKLAPVVGTVAEPLFEVVKAASTGVTAISGDAAALKAKLEATIGSELTDKAEQELAKPLAEIQNITGLFKPVRVVAEGSAAERTIDWNVGDFSKQLPGTVKLATFALDLSASGSMAFVVDPTDTAAPDSIPGTSFHLTAEGRIGVGAEAQASFSVLSLGASAKFSYMESVDFGFKVDAANDAAVPMLLAMTAGLTQVGFDVTDFEATRSAIGVSDGYVALENITLKRGTDMSAGGNIAATIPFKVGSIKFGISASLVNGKHVTMGVSREGASLIVDLNSNESNVKTAGFTFGLSVGIAALGQGVLTEIRTALGDVGKGLDEVEGVINKGLALEDKLNTLLPGQYIEKTVLAKLAADTDFNTLLGKLLGKPAGWTVTDIGDDLGTFIGDKADDVLGLFKNSALAQNTGLTDLAEEIKAELVERVGTGINDQLSKVDDAVTGAQQQLVSDVTEKLNSLDAAVQKEIAKLLHLKDINNFAAKVLGVIEDIRGQLKKVTDYISDDSSELLAVSIARQTENKSLITGLGKFQFSPTAADGTDTLAGAQTQYNALLAKPHRTVRGWLDPTVASLPAGVTFLEGSLKGIWQTTRTGTAAVGFLGMDFASSITAQSGVSVVRLPSGIQLVATADIKRVKKSWWGSRTFDISAASTYALDRAANENTDGMKFTLTSKDGGDPDKGEITAADMQKYLTRLVGIKLVPMDRAQKMIDYGKANGPGEEFTVLLSFDEASADAFCTAMISNYSTAVNCAAQALLANHTYLRAYMGQLFGSDWETTLTDEQQVTKFLKVGFFQIKDMAADISASQAAASQVRESFLILQDMPAKLATAFSALGKIVSTKGLTQAQIEGLVAQYTKGLKPWNNPSYGGKYVASDVTVSFFDALIRFAAAAPNVELPVSVLKYRQQADGPVQFF